MNRYVATHLEVCTHTEEVSVAEHHLEHAENAPTPRVDGYGADSFGKGAFETKNNLIDNLQSLKCDFTAGIDTILATVSKKSQQAIDPRAALEALQTDVASRFETIFETFFNVPVSSNFIACRLTTVFHTLLLLSFLDGDKY